MLRALRVLCGLSQWSVVRAAAAAAAFAAGAAATARSASGGIVAAAFVAAAATLHALRVRQLISQAAFQPSAQSRQPGWIQAQVLLLRHFDRDGLEGSEPGRTAERPAARPV